VIVACSEKTSTLRFFLKRKKRRERREAKCIPRKPASKPPFSRKRMRHSLRKRKTKQKIPVKRKKRRESGEA
jgi:hypothetical protein